MSKIHDKRKLKKDAYSLRPVRAFHSLNAFRFYNPISNVKGREAVHLLLLSLEDKKFLTTKETCYVLDVVGKDGVIQDFYITLKGINFLKKYHNLTYSRDGLPSDGYNPNLNLIK